MNINVVIIKNPFDVRIKDIKQLKYIPDQPVSFYTELAFLFEEKIPLDVSLNDKILTAEEVKTIIPKPEDFIYIVPVVEGGGFTRTLLTLAVMAAAVWAGGVTGLKALGWNEFNTKLGVSLIYVGGGMLVNTLCPIQPPQSPNFNQNYGWGSQQPVPAQGLPIGLTYGTVGIKTPAVLAKHVQTVGNEQKLNLLLCGGEGVCSVKDIKINDNPIGNIKGVEQPVISSGTNDQPNIDGFGETYSDKAIDYKLDKLDVWESAPKEVTLGGSGTSLEIELTFPQGLYYIKGNNDYHRKIVKVAARYSEFGKNDWKTWDLKDDENYNNSKEYKAAASGKESEYDLQPNTEIIGEPGYTGLICNGNGDAPIRRTYRIDNLKPARYEVQVRKYYVYKDDGVSRADEVHWTLLSQVFKQDFCRPGKVLVPIKALATEQLNGGMPTVTWTQTRCAIDDYGHLIPNKVYVWNPNNPSANKYELKDSDNPAWACYDLIHRCKKTKNIISGQYQYIVKGVPADRIVYDDFARWAAFCENYVLNSNDPKSKGLKCNIFIDSLRNLKDALDAVAIQGRGQVVIKGTKYTCLWDAPATPVGLITLGNVTIDSFSGEYAGKAERAKAVEVTFFNEAKNYERDTVTVYDEDYNTSDKIENPAQITLYGCTNFEQAYAEGKYRLRANKLLQKNINLKGDIDYINFAVNEVVNVSQDVLLVDTVKSGRVIEATSTYIKLDRYVTIESGKSYCTKVRLADDTIIERPVAEEPGETNVIHGDFARVQLFDVYSFGESSKVVKPFRILKIARDESNQRRTLSCIEYREELYHDSMEIPSTENLSYLSCPEVTNVAYDQETYAQRDGTMISLINLSWELPKRTHIREIVVYLSKDNGQSWQKYSSTKNTMLTISPLKSLQTYKIKICTVNELNFQSSGIITGGIYITGKDNPPSDVANITATKDSRDSTKVTLEWSAVNDVDRKGYEVRVGSAWDTAQKVTSVIADTKCTYTAGADGTYNFMVKAVDNSNNYSVNAAAVSVDMKVIPSSVTGFTATQVETDRSKVKLSWNANPETDISFYEIRSGSTWSTGTVIATHLKALNYDYTLSGDGNYAFMVKAVSVAGKESANPSIVSTTMKTTPSDVTGLKVSQLETDRSRVKISWNANPEADISFYEVRLGSIWNTGTVIATQLKALSCEYVLSGDGSVSFMVKAFTIAGKESINSATISPDLRVSPSDVTGLAIAQLETDRSKVRLSWNANPEKDISFYEIRLGTLWSTGTVIATQLKALAYEYTLPNEGNFNFMVKAVTVASKEGINPAVNTQSYTLKPNKPASGTITQDPADRSVFVLNWAQIPDKDLLQYEVRLGNDWNTASPISATKENTVKYKASSNGTYNFMVRAKNIAGYLSSILNLSISANLAPSDVSTFKIVQSELDKRVLKMSWSPVSDADLAYYEIREGINWDAGTLVATKIKTTYYDHQVTTEGSKTFLIKAVSIADFYSTTEKAVLTNVVLTPSKPASGLIKQDQNNKCRLTISWEKISDLDFLQYEVKCGTDWNTAAEISITKETQAVYTVANGGSYTFLVRAKNIGNFYSAVLAITADINVQPANITTFSASQNPADRTKLNFSWGAVSDSDLAYYEIRKGTSWDTAPVVATKIKNTFYDLILTTEGTQTYLIKAVNSGGFYSDAAKSVSVSAVLTPTKPGGGSAVSDAANRCKLNITWDKIADLDLLQYEVRYGAAWDTATEIAVTKETFTSYTVASGGSHTFLIKAKNIGGYYSSIHTINATVNINPSDVAGFSVSQNPLDRRILSFKWNAIVDSDFAYYEIRKGSSWDSATVFATKLKDISYSCQVTAEETATFLIKAFTTAGYGSASAKAAIIPISLTPSKPNTGDIKQDTNNKSVLLISWDAVADLDLLGYEIRSGNAWNNGTLVASTKETSIMYSIQNSGGYNFMVCAKSIGGFYSNPLHLSIIANAEPSDVTGFTATQYENDHGKIKLAWNAVLDKDFSYYEIKEGSTWDSATLIATRITALSYDTTISDERQYTFWIKAYNIAGKSSLNPASKSNLFNLNPLAPSNLDITQDQNDKSVLNITWKGTGELDLYEYELRQGLTWETAVEVTKTKELKANYKPTTSGDYKFILKAKNTAGYYSDELSDHYYVKLEPGDVSGFQAVQNGANVLMSWDKVEEADVVGYEIREGSTFDNGNLVATGVTTTVYQIGVDTEKNYRYHIKAINRSGKYSQNAATSGVTITGLPPKNVIQTYDEISLKNGTHNNTEFGESLINFSNFGGTFNNYPTTKFSEVGGSTVLKLQPRSLIEDYHFTGNIDSNLWKPCFGSDKGVITKNADGNLLYTVSVASSTGVMYKLPLLERNTVYVVDFKFRSNKASSSCGFINTSGSYSLSNCTPGSYSISNNANQWTTWTGEFTVGATGTEPTYFLFAYGSKVAGDTIEIEYAKIYKKSGQSGIYKYQSSGEYIVQSKNMGQIYS